MTPNEIIQHKQKGLANTVEEIRFMVAGALDGSVAIVGGKSNGAGGY